jgi:hypothetical protein
MTCISGEGITICGNFAKVEKKRPKDWSERDSAWIQPFDFKWRDKLGKVKCDCKKLEWRYAPYYGFSVYHMDDCAIGRHLKKHPGIYNLMEVRFPLLAQSE